MRPDSSPFSTFWPLSSDGPRARAQKRDDRQPDMMKFFSFLQEGTGGQAMGNWFKILQMLPRARRGGPVPSQRPKGTGMGLDVRRTRLPGLLGTMAVPPWGM